MDIRKVGVLWNSTKRAGLETARELIELMHAHGIEVRAQRGLMEALGISGEGASEFSDCQLIFALGGDGTLLSALDFAMPADIPLLGINLGRMGFLAEIEPSYLKQDVEALLAGAYRVESRMTMRAEGLDEERFFALNEIVISRSNTSVRMISVEIEADGALIDRISGDGVIVASATGSTAYSLSAGGPIVSPGLECFVLTPICPHTMNARPVVLKSDARVTVRLLGEGEAGQAVFDGKRALNLYPGKSGITIVKSQRQARFVRLHERNYFSLLRGKLSEWTH
ncbi:MAG: NAD(+)/NADH kinase [Eubacteriales bacterium]|nr:NAD(+)/NADH kinase [Eubacteriales bacterium]